MNTDRFKFRVWSKVNNRYEDDHLKLTQDGYLRVFHDGYKYDPEDEGYTIEQCTGLKDRNGKLIYEGDVVRTKEYGREVGGVNVWDYDTFTVKFDECRFCIDNDSRSFGLSARSKVEIIGNIHDDKFHNLAKLVYGKDGE